MKRNNTFYGCGDIYSFFNKDNIYFPQIAEKNLVKQENLKKEETLNYIFEDYFSIKIILKYVI